MMLMLVVMLMMTEVRRCIFVAGQKGSTFGRVS